MVLLQSHDYFDILLEMDLISGEKHDLSRTLAKPKNDEVKGSYTIIDHQLVCLYRDDKDLLHFRIGDQDFELNDDSYIQVFRATIHNMLVVMSGENEIFRWQYKPPKSLNFGLDMEDEEDLDFAIFVSNVTSHVWRRKTIYHTK